MARPVNSPKGLRAFPAVTITASGYFTFVSYAATKLVEANSTGLVVVGGVKISNAQTITANATGFLFTTVATKPSARTLTGPIAFLRNSTGVRGIMINTTGTTWKYVSTVTTAPS